MSQIPHKLPVLPADDTRRNALEVIYRPIGALTPAPHNPRRHSSKQVRQIAASIREFGWTSPLLIDENYQVVCGAGRLAAAKLLGYDEVPSITLTGMSEAQLRAYVIADNKLALEAGWDSAALATEFKYLIDLDFDVTLTGFATGEIDLVIGEAAHGPDEVPAVPANPVTRLGDLWLVGPHKLLCANALAADSYSQILGTERAQMMFTDPPYNVPIQGHVSGLGKARHREFAMASGELSAAEFRSFLTTFMGLAASVSNDGSLHYVCMDWRHLGALLSAGDEAYSELKNICVWAKTNGGMGSFYRSQHELICVFKNGKAPHINNIDLGRHGRYRTNVWSYAGANSFRQGRMDDLAIHPTVKPVQLVADAILDATRRDGIVLDPFSGSGSTLLAAHQTGRRGYAIEIDPAYVDASLVRLMSFSSLPVVHAVTGLTFEDIQAARTATPLALPYYPDENVHDEEQ